jgi:hypothetical protein
VKRRARQQTLEIQRRPSGKGQEQRDGKNPLHHKQPLTFSVYLQRQQAETSVIRRANWTATSQPPDQSKRKSESRELIVVSATSFLAIGLRGRFTRSSQMIRRVAVLIALVSAAFMPVLAQTQAHPPHPSGKPHNPSEHLPLDPATHAAMHARLLGNWSGTLSSIGSRPTEMQLAIVEDKQGNMAIKMKAAQHMKAGPASDIAVHEDGLHWTQALSGASCKATAGLETGSHHGPETMKGTMACARGDVAFTVHKIKG